MPNNTTRHEEGQRAGQQIYRLINIDTGLNEFEGSARDILAKYSINSATLSHASLEKGRKVKCPITEVRYYVEKTGKKTQRKDAPVKRVKKESELDRRVRVIEKHLDVYGNTICVKQLKNVLKRLEKDGYFVSVKKWPDMIIKDQHGEIVGKEKGDNVLTLIRKEEKHA